MPGRQQPGVKIVARSWLAMPFANWDGLIGLEGISCVSAKGDKQ